jgi:hypothetical protein
MKNTTTFIVDFVEESKADNIEMPIIRTAGCNRFGYFIPDYLVDPVVSARTEFWILLGDVTSISAQPWLRLRLSCLTAMDCIGFKAKNLYDSGSRCSL